MNFRLTLLAGGLSLAVAAPALADITITDGNVSGNPAQNVLLGSNTTATSIVGLTNTTSTPVVFTGDELLSDPSNGQARIEAAMGGFNFLEITLQNPALAFTAMEFNLLSTTGGGATISAIDNFGTLFTEDFTLGANGENRINLFATNNEVFKLVRIQTAADLADIRQIRVDGNPGFSITPLGFVPEPAAWAMMLLGFGAAGAMLRRRRAALV